VSDRLNSTYRSRDPGSERLAKCLFRPRTGQATDASAVPMTLSDLGHPCSGPRVAVCQCGLRPSLEDGLIRAVTRPSGGDSFSQAAWQVTCYSYSSNRENTSLKATDYCEPGSMRLMRARGP
jgi:hypothetical protein